MLCFIAVISYFISALHEQFCFMIKPSCYITQTVSIQFHSFNLNSQIKRLKQKFLLQSKYDID